MASGVKFTKASWTTNGGVVRTANANNITVRKIATVHGEFAEEEKTANAYLIAAAPDLLEQLKHARALLLDAYSVFEPHRLAGIDAAIDKAEGRAP